MLDVAKSDYFSSEKVKMGRVDKRRGKTTFRAGSRPPGAVTDYVRKYEVYKFRYDL